MISTQIAQIGSEIDLPNWLLAWKDRSFCASATIIDQHIRRFGSMMIDLSHFSENTLKEEWPLVEDWPKLVLTWLVSLHANSLTFLVIDG